MVENKAAVAGTTKKIVSGYDLCSCFRADLTVRSPCSTSLMLAIVTPQRCVSSRVRVACALPLLELLWSSAASSLHCFRARLQVLSPK
jgi:hypothetical protein